MERSTTKFQVTGISALLMNNPIGILLQPEPGAIGVKTNYGTPEEQARKVEYRDAKGNLYLPSIQFRKSILFACAGRKSGKMSAKKIVSASVFNVDDKTTLINPDTGKPLTTWTVDTQPAVVNHGRIARSRPRLDRWGAIVTFAIDKAFINERQVLELFQLAGTLSGVGDYKPANTGPFGQFEVELLK